MSETNLITELKRPIVAVFVSRRVINKLKNRKNNCYFRLKKLNQVNKIAGTTLYLFSYKDVDFEHCIIKGIYFDETEQIWKENDFPFPDVLYDRVKGNLQQRKNFKLVRERFKEMGIKKINPLDYFDKYELYKLIEKNDTLRPNLPITRLLESTTDLKFILEKSRSIYLKACRGSRGKQVMAITKISDTKYKYSFYSKQVVVGEVKDLYALFRVIHWFFQGKKVLVQQAIDLLTVDNRIIDIRGELQRNGNGELEITAAPARMGTKNAPIATRGKSYPFEVLFKKHFQLSDDKIKELKNTVDCFLIAVYKYLEESYGLFGEIGIDVGLDKNGKVWLIECNAKSAKVSLCNTGDKETIEKAFLNPLEYAKYISCELNNAAG
ncbi:YheC/YheD family endospore coat-associated protein [Candidatus Contubernalis alkaliaceticus]|uniref:YheC/YheD family endospore coat-associated protein n=1 Tax=Candidatus Contubernalis alkaliaceticus TaxID=338645 RepID=UPI001F4BE15C|nr:YheC/YheD family protein [Candidatus Contubernalis alkalaceticus]UNC92239.1 YheC/YheD family protein [Candidatus Contubernalis alkalaceticus]